MRGRLDVSGCSSNLHLKRKLKRKGTTTIEEKTNNIKNTHMHTANKRNLFPYIQTYLYENGSSMRKIMGDHQRKMFKYMPCCVSLIKE